MNTRKTHGSLVSLGSLGRLTVATMVLLGTIGSAAVAAEVGGIAPARPVGAVTDDPMPWGNSTVAAEPSAVTTSSSAVSLVTGVLDDTRLDLAIPDELVALASVLDPDQARAVMALGSAIISDGRP
jgi:hypothetical protein